MEKCLERGIDAEVYNSDAQEERREKIVRDLVSGEPGFKLL